MKQNKATKHALLMSVLSLVLCCSMLVGTTFAWFTDSVTSGKNKIVAGNLDVELYHTGAHGDEEKVSKTEDALFTDVDGNPILWEPGAAAFETFRVANEGTLALKFELALATNAANTVMDAAGNDTGKTIADVLKIAVVEDSSKYETREAMVEAVKDEMVTLKDYVSGNTVHSGKLLPKGATAPDPADGWKTESELFTVILYWEPSENDDLYNLKNGAYASDAGDDKPGELKIDLTVTLLAAQVPFESDSFDDQYDNKPFLPAEKLAARIAEDKAKAAEGYTFRIGDGDEVKYAKTESDKEDDFLMVLPSDGTPVVLISDYELISNSKGIEGKGIDGGVYCVDLNGHTAKANWIFMRAVNEDGSGYDFELRNGEVNSRYNHYCDVDVYGAKKVLLEDLTLGTPDGAGGWKDKHREYTYGGDDQWHPQGNYGANENMIKGYCSPIKIFMNERADGEITIKNVNTFGGANRIKAFYSTTLIEDCVFTGSVSTNTSNVDKETLYITGGKGVTIKNTTVTNKQVRLKDAQTVDITDCELDELLTEGNTHVTLTDCTLNKIAKNSANVTIVSGTYSFNPNSTKGVNVQSGSTVTEQDGVWVVTAGN